MLKALAYTLPLFFLMACGPKQPVITRAEAPKKQDSTIAAYLKTNKLSITADSTGLYYLETKKGNGQTAQPGQIAVVHYKGLLLNGTEFDNSYSRSPIEVPIGKNKVIKGWELALQRMSTGTKATVIIPYQLGYDEFGAGSDIPPFAPLLFEMELISLK